MRGSCDTSVAVDQQTLAAVASCSGVGLHGGAAVAMRLLPGPADSGYVFARRGATSGEIRASASAVCSTRQATSLAGGGWRVSSVEHLLAALHGMGIDNARVELDGDEVPALDGSAAPFVSLIRAAGVAPQGVRREVFRIARRIELRDGDRRIAVEPAAHFGIDVAIDFAHPSIARQRYCAEHLDRERFERELSAARTFGFLRDAESLRAAGLARGASLENTLVLDDAGLVGDVALRFPDEFARHKALDLCGDLAVLGYRIAGRVCVERGGHALHHRLARAIDAARRDAALS